MPVPIRLSKGVQLRDAIIASFALASIWAWALAGTPEPGMDDANMVPNAGLHGTAGAIEDGSGSGTVNGFAPTAWRAFAVGSAELDIDIVPLAADQLYPGSPATNAVRLEVVNFGADQGLDHTTHLISLDVGRQYQASVWVKSANGDDSDQDFLLQSPFFDEDLNFTGRDPMFVSSTAGSDWSQVVSPVATALKGEAFAHLAIRLGGDGGEDAILVALPEVTGLPVANVTPNPPFSGSGGSAAGNVVGNVPDQWRAFAVGDGTLTITPMNLAAGVIYPGSPATRAVEIEVTGSTGPAEGFDHTLSLSRLATGYRHWGEVWIRSGSASQQGVTIAMPLFDESETFLGVQPGSLFAEVGPEWTFLAGPAFTAAPDQALANMAFRLQADGGEDRIVIALPRLVGPDRDIFADRFSASP